MYLILIGIKQLSARVL